MAERQLLTHPLLANIGVPHAFGQRDDPPPPEGLRRPQQLHGREVAIDIAAGLEPVEADAVVTMRPGAWVGVVTADCVPVLAASADGRVVGAIHAGWRGLADGVVEAGVAALRRRAPDARLHAVVGPCIGAECYEVDTPVLAALERRYGAEVLGKATETSRPGHARLDLGGVVGAALAACSVGWARLASACTACDPTRFHSYRRDGAAAGRLLHAIAPRVEPG